MFKVLIVLLFPLLLAACGSTPPSQPRGEKIPINSEQTQKLLRESIKNPNIEVPENRRTNIRFASDTDELVNTP